MNPLISKCPVCGGSLAVTRLHCQKCDTTIEGSFSASGGVGGPFAQLSDDQMQFLLTFLRCEGKFNRMEEELKLSYPTLRNRFNEILRAMGFEPARDDNTPRPSVEERRRILEDLDQGRISWADAQRRLRGKKDDLDARPVEPPVVKP